MPSAYTSVRTSPPSCGLLDREYLATCRVREAKEVAEADARRKEREDEQARALRDAQNLRCGEEQSRDPDSRRIDRG